MVKWKTTPVSCIQPITIQTSITQQRCCCPIQQDPGEFHTAVHLKAGGWDHTEEVELREQQRECLYSQPSDHSNGAQNYRTPRAAGKMAHTTLSTQPQQCPWKQVMGQQWNRSLRPHPSSNWGAHDPGACPPQSAVAETLSFTKTGHGRGACTTLALSSPSPSLFSKACISGDPRCKERALHLKGNRGSGRSKSPMTLVSHTS